MNPVPALRLSPCNSAPVDPGGEYVLYWMIAARRLRYNYGLQRAVEWALELGKPLVILEALRVDYPWASDRLHRFVLDGMRCHRDELARTPVRYFPYVETRAGEGRGLLSGLARSACVVVTDEFPGFFLPAMVKAAASRTRVRLEQVDSNGLLPLRAATRCFARAHDFRRFLQKNLLPHLADAPAEDPLRGVTLPGPGRLPFDVERRFRPALDAWLEGDGIPVDWPIDHDVSIVRAARGGPLAARERLEEFLAHRLSGYLESRHPPEREQTSGLSPYLHFGHLAAHEIFAELARREPWCEDDVEGPANGRREGWWGMSADAEAFVDQFVTWREVGFNMASRNPDHAQYRSLPAWAMQTLDDHRGDPREFSYTRDELEAGKTHDLLWNASQGQLVQEGRIHNYLRMLWGKKVLQWSESPEEALDLLIELNNKYALDGRDPNSYSGIFWCLGRYDRAWGPERPIFGKVRYMASENTARKFPVRGYVARFAP